MTQTCLIIGASHAAGQLAVSLRQGGWVGPIKIIGDEAYPPYQHPPLSKDFLSGDKSVEDILIRPESLYADANIDLILSTRVSQINRTEKYILTDKGQTLAYDKLVLTTGARVRRLSIPGEGLEGVYYLRDMDDVKAIKQAVQTAQTVVIIGGGYIGLETAASLTKLGLSVTVLEAMPRILQRVTAPELSKFYKRVHSEEGVSIVENVSASEIKINENGYSVLTGTGAEFGADFVIIGIGVVPNTELAEEAGLEIGNGIIINEFCQTNDPDIYAAGDVTWHYNLIYDRHIRLESVPNATEQAKTVAAHLCHQSLDAPDSRAAPPNNSLSLKSLPLNSLPWFWSDQFDLKLQIAGLSQGYTDIIIRGEIDTGRSFAAFYFNDVQLIAVDAVNAPREFAFARMVLSKGQNLDKTKIGDLAVSLKETLLVPDVSAS